jgi:hypothetical protein
VWDATTFTKNRDRLLDGKAASQFRPKNGSGEPLAPGRNDEQDFQGERRTNGCRGQAVLASPDRR